MSAPQFRRRTHRAAAKLAAAAQGYRWMYELADQVRAAGADWPAGIYVPTDAINRALPDYLVAHGGPQMARGLLARGAEYISRMVEAGITWATWRMGQGIYRFDPALYPALIATELDGDIPADMLGRLPEWCVYVETPGIAMPAMPGGEAPAVHGAWARLDREDHGRLLLAVTPDTDADDQIMPPTQHIPLSAGSVRDAVATLADDWIAGGYRIDAGLTREELVDGVTSWLRPVLNLLLYLCSESPDLTRRGQPAAPANPEPVRTRRDGWRLFAADGPREWDVGVRIGAALRAAYAREETGGSAAATGRHVRPHVRRAHWHTILSGARKREDGTTIPSSDRRAELRWMPPIPVAIDDAGELPAVIHPVRP